jgi:hypothetical protein
VRASVSHVHTELTTNLLFRSFLLFIPATKTNLRAVLSYYSATATVNQEGDVHINDTMQGLGTAPVPIHTLISIMASRPCPETFYGPLSNCYAVLSLFPDPTLGIGTYCCKNLIRRFHFPLISPQSFRPLTQTLTCPNGTIC